MDISIVISIFNESENAGATLNQNEEALAYFKGTYEIVSVDD